MTERLFEAELANIARWEPHVHALVHGSLVVLPQDLERRSGPLSGWSVAIKDIVDIAGVPTGYNAPFVPAVVPAKSAGIVELLEEAGATILAKAVTTTFAFFDPGPTCNPWNLNHTPGGSSSGSAAAVASGMVRLAIGSQTVGSINRPASYCGVVGFKPTYGALPLDGVFPLASVFDTLGTFTRSVDDAIEAYSALTRSPVAPQTSPLRVAVVEDLLCEPPEAPTRDTVRTLAETLASAGHTVESIQLPEALRDAYANHWRLVAAGAAQAHEELFSRYGADYPPKLRELIERGREVSSDEIDRLERHRETSRTTVHAVLADFDVILSPSAPGPVPVGIDATGDPRMNLLWTYLGLPTLTIPAAVTSDGLPLGVQLTGASHEDARVLAAGGAIEAALNFNATPSCSGRLPSIR
jgi:Asp-tRNA(Asn)/Glu-tRNA(Gln) amidotransferase A subunit family amidase